MAILGVTGLCGGGIVDVADALPAGQVPVYIIPYVKSWQIGSNSDSMTVITITRVGGTRNCAVSVDWRRKIDGWIMATTTTTLLGNTATNHYVGTSASHCSVPITADIVNCDTAPPGNPLSTLDDAVAIVGTVGSCTGGLAVDARVIYTNPSTFQPMAIHSLKVLKPYKPGNKGE